MPDILTAPPAAGTSDAPVDPGTSLAADLYSTTPAVPATPATPTGADPAAPPAGDAPDPAVADGPEYIQGEDGQWRRADGTFATAEEIAQIDAQLADADKAKADEDANRPSTVVQVRGRNGEMVEVEAQDEETAQLLRQNVNDGMRRREFVEAKAEVDAMRARLEQIDALIQTNPIGVIRESLSKEQRLEVVAAFLAEDFQDLIPVIQQYDQDPQSRLRAITDAQARTRQQQAKFQELTAAQRAAAEVRTAVASLIPDTAPDAVQDKFYRLARLELTAALDAGQPVNKDTIPQILATVLQHPEFSGFGSAAPAAPARPRITLAKSGSPKPAAPAAAPTAPTNASQRLRLVQQRRNAAAIPPQGRTGHAKPAPLTVDRAFQDAAHLIYGDSARVS